MSTIGIKVSLDHLARSAWQSRLDPTVHHLALKLTEPEVRREDKMRALVNELHRSHGDCDQLDADDACAFVAAAAMSVGIPCWFIGVRFGSSWTCWLSYENGIIWETIDPLRQKKPDREPDEQVVRAFPKDVK